MPCGITKITIKILHTESYKITCFMAGECGIFYDKNIPKNRNMRAIVQRVKNAQVSVNGGIIGRIGKGLLVYLGVGRDDDETDAVFIADKIVNLRIFADSEGKMNPVRDKASEMPDGRQGRPVSNRMNLSVKDTALQPLRQSSGRVGSGQAGQILVISSFTLFGDCRKGRRPGFDLAAQPETAEKLYEKVVELVKAEGLEVQKGVFAAYMDVTAANDGPINFLLDSKRQF
jgi:D-tyrosyl-tRNA(Tyr) deacylase